MSQQQESILSEGTRKDNNHSSHQPPSMDQLRRIESNSSPSSPPTTISTPDQIIVDTTKVVSQTSSLAKSKESSSTKPKSTKYKSTKKEDPTLIHLEFAPVARNLQIGSIYTLFMCGFTAVVMKPTDPVWASRIPGAYCLFLSIILYTWCFFSEFNKEAKETVENILNPRYWPERICSILSIMNRNESQCAFCFFSSIYTFFCVQTALAGFNLLFAALFFLVASIRREKPHRITGLV